MVGMPAVFLPLSFFLDLSLRSESLGSGERSRRCESLRGSASLDEWRCEEEESLREVEEEDEALRGEVAASRCEERRPGDWSLPRDECPSLSPERLDRARRPSW